MCPRCGKEIQVHYSLTEQLHDPYGLLVRDPKYVSRRFQVRLIVAIVLVVAAVIVAMLMGLI
jgi:hypothetical protein